MTYRTGFSPLLKGIKNYVEKEYNNDQGWGCMIRVGQNMMAEILRKHIKKTDNEKYNLSNIIHFFIDEKNNLEFNEGNYKNGDFIIDEKQLREEGLFSIQEISSIAYLDHKLKPGTWLQPNHICYILETINNKFSNKYKANELKV